MPGRQSIRCRQTPLVTNTALIAGNFELVLARLIQTATLEALAFTGAGTVSVAASPAETANESASKLHMLTISAHFPSPSSADFTKRAPLQAAARALNGELAFHRSDTQCSAELRWAPEQYK